MVAHASKVWRGLNDLRISCGVSCQLSPADGASIARSEPLPEPAPLEELLPPMPPAGRLPERHLRRGLGVEVSGAEAGVSIPSLEETLPTAVKGAGRT